MNSISESAFMSEQFTLPRSLINYAVVSLLIPALSLTFSRVGSPLVLFIIILTVIFASTYSAGKGIFFNGFNQTIRNPIIFIGALFCVQILFGLMFSHKISRDIELGIFNFIIPIGLCVALYNFLSHTRPSISHEIFNVVYLIYSFTALTLVARLYFEIPIDYPVSQQFGPLFYNHAIVNLIILFFPVLAFVRNEPDLGNRQKLIYVSGLLVMTAAALYFGSNQTAGFALTLGLIAVLMSILFPRASFWIVSTGTIGVALIQPIWGQLIRLVISDDIFKFFKVSFEFRSYIWLVFSEKIWEAPIWGHGLGSSEVFDFSALIRNKYRSDFVGGVHPHNNFLQIWYEFGMFGAAILVVWLVSIFKLIAKQKAHHQPELLGSLVSILTFVLMSFGLWQAWWIIAIGANFLLFARIVNNNKKLIRPVQLSKLSLE